MTPLEAVDTVIMSECRRWPAGGTTDRALALNVALAQLSGSLPACDTEDDLLAACRAGMNLLLSRQVSTQVWEQAADAVEQELSHWAAANDESVAEAEQLIAAHANEPVPTGPYRQGKVFMPRQNLNDLDALDEWDD